MPKEKRPNKSKHRREIRFSPYSCTHPQAKGKESCFVRGDGSVGVAVAKVHAFCTPRRCAYLRSSAERVGRMLSLIDTACGREES
jgi:hypothetical protein